MPSSIVREARGFAIGGRSVGPGQPAYLIAEVGSNHDGQLDRALALVRAAAVAGADAVKFQSFTADCLSRRGEPAFEVLQRLSLPGPWHRILHEQARACGIEFLSTPFSEERADLLAEVGVAAFKIASGDLTHHALLRHVAGLGRPILLSTGLADLGEVGRAVSVARAAGATKLALLHCVAAYPPSVEELNLRSIAALERRFEMPVGFSDHSPGHAAVLVALALGASVIEKHVTFDRTLPGPDHAYALTFGEFQELVRAVRLTEVTLGTGIVDATPSEKDGRLLGRRSVHAAQNLDAGVVLTSTLWKLVRPAEGVAADEADELLGRRLIRPIREDQPITWDDVA